MIDTNPTISTINLNIKVRSNCTNISTEIVRVVQKTRLAITLFAEPTLGIKTLTD